MKKIFALMALMSAVTVTSAFAQLTTEGAVLTAKIKMSGINNNTVYVIKNGVMIPGQNYVKLPDNFKGLVLSPNIDVNPGDEYKVNSIYFDANSKIGTMITLISADKKGLIIMENDDASLSDVNSLFSIEEMK